MCVGGGGGGEMFFTVKLLMGKQNMLNVNVKTTTTNKNIKTNKQQQQREVRVLAYYTHGMSLSVGLYTFRQYFELDLIIMFTPSQAATIFVPGPQLGQTQNWWNGVR